jgi:NADPH-dependent 2,4-dienoyl-CoA reductase/sulfur reductase-like enzyme/rhodanese-related sulfurtransferase
MSANLRVLIVGGVACGPKTAARLKRIMPEAEITMVEKGAMVSYGACGLPYYVEGTFTNINALTHTPAGVSRTPEFFRTWKGFETLTRTEAMVIDRETKSVRVRNLDTAEERTLPYDKLVLATGGEAFRPPIPGIDLDHVWFMTHPDDAASLVAVVEQRELKKAVLVGAGFIGLEMAEALVNKGLDVTMVEMMGQIMPGIIDEDIARMSQRHLEDNDVALVLGERVTALEGNGRVRRVVTNRQSIEADLVVIGVGTRPNDRLAREAGLACDGGIIVNANGQTSDPDIYAGGDCVRNQFVHRLVDERLFVPLGSTANKHGRVIANHIAGRPTPFSGIGCSSIVRAFDFTIGRTGVTETMARRLNIDYAVTTWSGQDKPHYMEGSRLFAIKMLASRRDRKVLGIQVAGMGDGAKRLDAAASAIYFGATLDQLADIDFGYAPPYSPPIDPLAVCAHVLTNKLDGLADGIGPLQAKAQMDAGGCLLLDVRIEDEAKMEWIPHTDRVHIPLDQLRERFDELPRDTPILTYCKVSMRGYEAQRILNAEGFDNVRFIEGGVAAWPFETDMPGL